MAVGGGSVPVVLSGVATAARNAHFLRSCVPKDPHLVYQLSSEEEHERAVGSPARACKELTFSGMGQSSLASMGGSRSQGPGNPHASVQEMDKPEEPS